VHPVPGGLLRDDLAGEEAGDHVAELDDAVGHHEGMVVRQRDDPGAEPDVPGALGGGDEQLGLTVDLVAAGMVLADPRLGKAELFEPPHQLEIALHAEERIPILGMKWRQKDPRAKGAKLAHAPPPSNTGGIIPHGSKAAGFSVGSTGRSAGVTHLSSSRGFLEG